MTTFLKRTALVVALAAIAAPVASATTMSDSHDRSIRETHVVQQPAGDALDRYLANRRNSAPDALDRFLHNAQSGKSSSCRFIQRRGGV